MGDEGRGRTTRLESLTDAVFGFSIAGFSYFLILPAQVVNSRRFARRRAIFADGHPDKERMEQPG
jgi:hypothetical protein